MALAEALSWEPSLTCGVQGCTGLHGSRWVWLVWGEVMGIRKLWSDKHLWVVLWVVWGFLPNHLLTAWEGSACSLSSERLSAITQLSRSSRGFLLDSTQFMCFQAWVLPEWSPLLPFFLFHTLYWILEWSMINTACNKPFKRNFSKCHPCSAMYR